MEWTCVRCGRCEAAKSWARLAILGWSFSGAGDCLCVSCADPAGPDTARALARPAGAELEVMMADLVGAVRSRGGSSRRDEFPGDGRWTFPRGARNGSTWVQARVLPIGPSSFAVDAIRRPFSRVAVCPQYDLNGASLARA
jgi:hypothetical protein